MKWSFMTDDGKPLEMQGCLAGHSTLDSSCAPIHCDGKVVAMVIATGDEPVGRLMGTGLYITNACNAYEPMRRMLDYLYHCIDKQEGYETIAQDIRGILGYTPK